MTLNTKVAVGKPTDVRKIFDFCNQLLNAPGTVEWSEGDCDGHRAGQSEIYNRPMQGLPAWLWIYHGSRVHEHDEWCDSEVGPAKWDDTGQHVVTQDEVDQHVAEVAADPTMNGWAAIEVTFDTAYGYRGDGGESCSDLHARLLTALGQWLDARDLPWKWQNEFTGEWHDGIDGLAEFGDAFAMTGAQSWFEDVVKPAIASGGLT
jgi:hypothetical protein